MPPCAKNGLLSECCSRLAWSWSSGRGHSAIAIASTSSAARVLRDEGFNLRRAESFDVARPRQIEVAPGDKVLIRANDEKLGLINGQVLTVAGIEPDGALTTREGLSVPAEFRQWCHG